MLDLKSLKSFDFRSLQKYASPQFAEDVNSFLEGLPQKTNQTLLIIMGVTWAVASAAGLYTTVQLKQLTELRTELQDMKSLQPRVPTIKNVPVKSDLVAKFVEESSKIYGDLTIKANGSSVLITAKSTAFFGQFRESIGHVQNGGTGWRVTVDRFCVGRECPRDPLGAVLKINKVSVSKT